MAEPHTLEERFSQLEARVAQLEQQRRIQENWDVALLARIDGFIDDLRRSLRLRPIFSCWPAPAWLWV